MATMERQSHHLGQGYTLVELMIAIAVLSILTAIAIPAYTGYVRESRLASIRTTLNGLRTPLEDYRLDNGNYGSAATLVDVAGIQPRFGWDPTGDISGYTYTVAVPGGTISYDVWGQYGSGDWVRCETRFSKCCDSTSGSSGPSSACP
jgi:prepilin-type N-terminal cleavage/methylation domain-containing protein